MQLVWIVALMQLGKRWNHTRNVQLYMLCKVALNPTIDTVYSIIVLTMMLADMTQQWRIGVKLTRVEVRFPAGTNSACVCENSCV